MDNNTLSLQIKDQNDLVKLPKLKPNLQDKNATKRNIKSPNYDEKWAESI